MRIGDVVELEGREVVCLRESSKFYCKALGTDQLYIIRSLNGQAIIRNISPVIKKAFDIVQPGKQVIVERVLLDVIAVQGDNVVTQPAASFQECASQIAPNSRIRTDIPIFNALPRISPQDLIEDISMAVFARYPATAFLWEREVRNQAMLWIKDHAPQAMLPVAIEAEMQARLAPIHLSHGYLNLGFIRAASPNDLWVRKNALDAFIKWGQKNFTKAKEVCQQVPEPQKAVMIELLDDQASHTKWKRQLVETLTCGN